MSSSSSDDQADVLLVTLAEAARRLAMSRYTFDRLLRRDALPFRAVRIGGLVRIRVSDLDAFVRAAADGHD